MDANIFCKGMWVVIGEDGEEHEIFCSKRETCYRYKAQWAATPIKSFFDVVPARLNPDCPYYIHWADLRPDR